MNKNTKIALSAAFVLVIFFLGLVFTTTPNNPYRSSEDGASIYYTTFDEPPKHLDPAKAYSSDEYSYLEQVYEPLTTYHYLKRPYELMPMSAEFVPAPVYYDNSGNRLKANARAENVAKAVYNIKVKKNIMFQPHPAFAMDKGGDYIYRNIKETSYRDISDFIGTGTRELLADDFIYQIKRLADPRVNSPIFSILANYIDGFTEFRQALTEEISNIRAQRKKTQGIGYNITKDEALNPIRLDRFYDDFPFPGIEQIDEYSFNIILKKKYPQFVYWLSMPFFSPMPFEAIDFYSEPNLIKNNITLDRYPVGTGAYRIERLNPNLEIVLTKNENFHDEFYPTIGEDGDIEKGLLNSSGEKLPFIEKIVFKLEKEAIPRWNKFLQGYFDTSGISSESFDQAVTMGGAGEVDLTKKIRDKNIELETSSMTTIYYLAFNMNDEVMGGLTDKKRKLRQAVSIALDFEEYTEIFNNGRGLPSQGVLPPGIYGYDEKDYNPFVYDWDEKKNRPKRKSIDEAKRLLSEAGYANGRDEFGKPLVITFDNSWTGVDAKTRIDWFIKRLKLIGVELESRTTDYNRFRDKVSKGNFQLLFWGWNADYPDPENFMFLLYSKNGRVKYQGENTANYDSRKFDKLFKKMENMDNSPERLKIIKELNLIAQTDAPWVFAFNPVSFGLNHGWVKNQKANTMVGGTMKYLKIDTKQREQLRHKWNRPNLWPIIILMGILLVSLIPIIRVRSKK